MAVKVRESQFEALRIFATIAITLNHIPCSENALTANWYVRQFFFLGGQFGVNLFVIIGAWFLQSSAFKSSRVLRIVTQMVFYTLSLDILSLLFGASIHTRDFLKSFSYWFCFGYVIMLIIGPFLRKMDENSRFFLSIVGGGCGDCCNRIRLCESVLASCKIIFEGTVYWPCMVFLCVYPGQRDKGTLGENPPVHRDMVTDIPRGVPYDVHHRHYDRQFFH